MKYAIVRDNKVVDYVDAPESYYDRLVNIFSDCEVIIAGNNEMFQPVDIGQYYINNEFLRFMKIAQLTVEQYRLLFGQELTPGQRFTLAISPDGILCIPESDIIACTNPDFQWVKDLTIQDYSSDIPSTTPPPMTKIGVILPTGYETLGLFPNNQFNLNGFIVEFVDVNGQLAVDVAYLGWEAFRKEQDNGINFTVKEQFTNLWYDVVAKYQAGDTIQLP